MEILFMRIRLSEKMFNRTHIFSRWWESLSLKHIHFGTLAGTYSAAPVPAAIVVVLEICDSLCHRAHSNIVINIISIIVIGRFLPVCALLPPTICVCVLYYYLYI